MVRVFARATVVVALFAGIVAVGRVEPAGALLVPDPPAWASLTPYNSTRLDAAWAPSAGATHYFIDVYRNDTYSHTVQCSCTSLPIVNLVPSSTYKVWVWAANSSGRSLGFRQSNPAMTTAAGSPDPLLAVAAAASPATSTLEVSWTLATTGPTANMVQIAVRQPGGSAAVVIGQCSLPPAMVYPCSGTSSETVVGLTPGQAYFVQVSPGIDGLLGNGSQSGTVTLGSGCAGSASYCLSVDGTDVVGPGTGRASGLLHSARNADQPTLESLGVTNWRLSAPAFHGAPMPDMTQYETAQSVGASITVLLSDAWYAWTDDQTAEWGAAPPWANWGDYRAFVKDYMTKVLIEAYDRGWSYPDYWDVMNEPDGLPHGCESPGCYFSSTNAQSATIENVLRLYRETYEAVQELEDELTGPFAGLELPLLGPSLTMFTARPNEWPGRLDLATFLEYSANGPNGPLVWGAVSWHENTSGPGPTGFRPLTQWTVSPEETVETHVAVARSLIAHYPGLGSPEILINEFGPGDRWELPGYQAGMIAAFEREGVDQATHACFSSQNHADNVSHCFETQDNATYHATFDGQVSKLDGTTPYPIYWVSKAYADMSDGSAAVVSSDASHPTVSAFATRDDATSSLSVLVGRIVTCRGGIDILGIPNGDNLNCVHPPAGPVDVPLTFNYPYAATGNVRVVVHRIPFTWRNTTLVQPPLVSDSIVALSGGQATINLSPVNDADALTITIQPA